MGFGDDVQAFLSRRDGGLRPVAARRRNDACTQMSARCSPTRRAPPAVCCQNVSPLKLDPEPLPGPDNCAGTRKQMRRAHVRLHPQGAAPAGNGIFKRTLRAWSGLSTNRPSLNLSRLQKRTPRSAPSRRDGPEPARWRGALARSLPPAQICLPVSVPCQLDARRSMTCRTCKRDCPARAPDQRRPLPR